MNKQINLEDLAESCDKVYLDNNIFSKQENQGSRNNKYGDDGIQQMLITANSFEEMDSQRLAGQCTHASKLNWLVSVYPSFACSGDVLQEYKTYIDNIGYDLQKLPKAGVSTRQGMLCASLLQDIYDHYLDTWETLNERKNSQACTAKIEKFIRGNCQSQNIPYPDINLVSQAIYDATKSKKTAIVSADYHISKLIIDFARSIRANPNKARKFRPKERIVVYSPCYFTWIPEMNLAYEIDSDNF